jgi:hypothetical protein
MSEIADTVTTNKGMGAIPSAKGVTFRVWAPHASVRSGIANLFTPAICRV